MELKKMKETKSKYLEIKLVLNKDYYACINIQQDVIVGYIKRRRLGRFMHWCLEPESETYFSNGCLKEISKFITELYSRK
jgi:hypothetical protein